MQEPTRATDRALKAVLDELIQREPIFHRPEFGTTRADFERMIVPDYWETGASGRRYSREYILDELERRHSHPNGFSEDDLAADDFRCQQLAPDLYLLTYNLTQQNTRRTRRSTIWRHTAEGWKIVFHQGTIIQEAS